MLIVPLRSAITFFSCHSEPIVFGGRGISFLKTIERSASKVSPKASGRPNTEFDCPLGQSDVFSKRNTEETAQQKTISERQSHSLPTLSSHECQEMARSLPSPLVFPTISTDFTPTP